MKRTPTRASSADSDPQDLPDFRAWLRQYSDLTIRSQHDVCSRLRRLAQQIGLDKLRSEDNVNRLFETREVAAEMTVSVRSQMKRAANIYLQFLSRRRK